MTDLMFFISSKIDPEIVRIMRTLDEFKVPYEFTEYPEARIIEISGGITINLDKHEYESPRKFMWTSPITKILSILGARDLLDFEKKEVAATPKQIGDLIRVGGQYAIILNPSILRPRQAIARMMKKANEPILYQHTVAVIPPDFWYAAVSTCHVKSAYKGLCPGIEPEKLLGWRARELVDQHKVDPEIFEHMVRGLSDQISKRKDRIFDNKDNPDIDEIVDLTDLPGIIKIQWPVVREALLYTRVAGLVQDGDLCRLLNASQATLTLFRQEGVELGFKDA